jgi:hypothetical protein
MATSVNRTINVYVNGEQVENNIKSIRSAMVKLQNEQKKMTIGSDEYVAHTKKIKELKGYIDQHNAQLKETESKWAKLVKSPAAMAAAAAVALKAVASFVTKAFNAWEVQERAIRKVEQALKQTGGTVGLTLSELEKEASALQKKTIYADEAIMNDVTARLLTFTRITGDNFKRTQSAVLDLATSMNGDLSGAVTALGKAINDPLKGLSALGRQGIQFTDQQKATIKTLVESNKLYEAQSVILDEINRRFGGQAEAAAKGVSVWKQVSNSFGDMWEAIGERMASGTSKIGTFFRDLFDGIAGAIQPAKDLAKQFDEQLNKIANLQTDIVPLLNRYDQLKSKTKLNKDEQEELKTIIEKVTDVMPGAATAFDEYGKAISISTDRVREMVETEIARLKVVKKDTIEYWEDELKDAEKTAENIAKQIKEIEETGTYKKDISIPDPMFGAPMPSTRSATQDEVAEKIEENKKALETIRGIQAELDRLTGKTIEDQIKARAELNAKMKEYSKKEIKELEALAAKGDEIAQKVLDARRNIESGGNEKKTAEKEKNERHKLLDDILKLQEQFNDKMAGLRNQLHIGQLEGEDKEKVEAVHKYMELHRIAEEGRDIIVNSKVATDEQIAQAEKDLAARRITIQEQLETELAVIREKWADKRLEEQKKTEEKINTLLKSGNKEQQQAIAEKYQELLNLMQQDGFDTVELYKRLQEELDAIKNSEEQEDIFGMSVEDWKNTKRNIEEVINIVEQLGDVWSAFNSKQRAHEENDLRRYRKNADEKLKAEKKRLNLGLINEEEYAASVEKIEQDLDAEEKRIQRDQARREKMLNIFQAVINTASAIVEALPNIPLSVIAGVMGAIQIATIASTPLPELRTGGKVTQDGVYRMAEENKPEIVLSNRTITDKELGPISEWLLARQERRAAAFPFHAVVPDVSDITHRLPGSGNARVQTIEQDNHTEIHGLDEEKFTTFVEKIDNLLDKVEQSNQYLRDPRNRRAYVSYDLQRQTEEEMYFLDKVGKL